MINVLISYYGTEREPSVSKKMLKCDLHLVLDEQGDVFVQKDLLKIFKHKKYEYTLVEDMLDYILAPLKVENIVPDLTLYNYPNPSVI